MYFVQDNNCVCIIAVILLVNVVYKVNIFIYKVVKYMYMEIIK